MKVFIVTPSFNSVDTINRTIQSVVSQAGDFTLHYHVQDGGSADGTVDVLKRWEDLINRQLLPISCRSIVFSWDSSADAGMYDAIAKGFWRFKAEANDWLTWINADDVLLPTAMPLLLKIEADPLLSGQVHWVTGAAATCREGCQDVMTERVLCSEVISLGLADGKHWGFVQQEGTFFRHHAWKTAGAREAFSGMRFAGDWNLWRLLAKDHKVFQFKYPTAMFSSRAGQLSQSGRNDYEREMLAVVSAETRARSLLDLRGRNIDALYLSPDVKTGSVLVEGKTIEKHLAHRVEKLSALTKSVATTSPIDAGQKHANTESIHLLPPKKAVVTPQRVANCVFYDAEWQFPAVTEQHAFRQANALLPNVAGMIYFAFPWATLIDLLNGKKEDAKRLHNVLNEAGALLRSSKRVVTVCQHILMLNHQDMFEELGITDVFWTHAIIGQRSFPEHPRISIRPFPLYPVQAVGEYVDPSRARPVLYSFVGARANKWYLTQSRSFIFDLLGSDKRATVIVRDTWHYHRAVYEHQINRKAMAANELMDNNASNEFRELLKGSIFSLCPSGSGPNSIRLWESIGLGAIPVILADTYLPPADAALWEEAVVFCPETEVAIKALPARLEEMARDKALLERKRHAMKQLWMLYGPDCFIYDVQKLFVELAAEKPSAVTKAPSISFAPIIEEAKLIEHAGTVQPERLGPFILGCSTRAMGDPSGFRKCFMNNASLRYAYTLAMRLGEVRHTELMSKVLQQKKIELH